MVVVAFIVVVVVVVVIVVVIMIVVLVIILFDLSLILCFLFLLSDRLSVPFGGDILCPDNYCLYSCVLVIVVVAGFSHVAAVISLFILFAAQSVVLCFGYCFCFCACFCFCYCCCCC